MLSPMLQPVPSAINRVNFTYARPVRVKCAKSHFNKLKIFQDQVIRIITDAPRFVSNENTLKELKIFQHFNTTTAVDLFYKLILIKLDPYSTCTTRTTRDIIS